MIDSLQHYENRFWSYVKRGAPDECWPWQGGLSVYGYGVFATHVLGRTRQIKSHRLALIFSGVHVPDDRYVCHRCDNPRCVNPAHLFIGTAIDNNRDRDAKGRGGGRKIRGENHPGAKLTREQVAEIRASAESSRRVAKKYGVSFSMVCMIRRGDAWNDHS